MAIYGYTKNYKLIKPQYDTDTWHDYEYDNLDTIDAVLSAIYASGNWKGFWATNTAYVVGDVVIDRDTDTMYKVMVDHTTSEATFAAEQTAHPDYYELWSPNNLAESWAIKTDGKVSNEDYSAKAYAISSGLIDDGSAKEWAVGSGAIGNTNEYSAKKYATDAHDDYISMTTNPNVAAVGSNINNVNVVGQSISSVNTVAGNVASVNTVAGVSTDVTAVASIASSVPTVANNDANITTVATNISDVNTAATNIAAIQDAYNNANTAQTMATQASQSASEAAQSATNAAISAAGTHFKLFHHQWFDYELNDMTWLRADTFSWQSGTVYTNAYNHLVDDIDGITPATETVGGQTVTFYRASDGHKIVLADQETTVNNIYTATGVAWYYILDTVNNRFKLPRTKYDFNGLRGNVGDYIPESLPNISGSLAFKGGAIESATAYEGAFSPVAETGRTGGILSQSGSGPTYTGGFDASRSSSTYQNNAPVQQRGTQQYLYFYVGQYTQSAIEQTAGLNSELFNNKIDIDGNNVITAGANKILNTSSYTTNRILEIPQDIKLELNNGTLTLKAGSKVYVPNGFEADGTTPKFDVKTVPNDLSWTFNQSNALCFVRPDNTQNTVLRDYCFSGSTAPTSFQAGQYAIWYDTTNNFVKFTSNAGSTWSTGTSLPYNSVSSDDSYTAFNGFGYIGSTVFALPGVNVQIPNGRNEDGTYRITPYSTQNVIAREVTGTGVKDIILYSNGTLNWSTGGTYLAEDGYVRSSLTSVIIYGVTFARVLITTAGKIDSFVPRNVDSVANSNASNFSQSGRSLLSGLGMPSGRYIDLTLGASGSTYTAPANGWVSIKKIATAAGQSVLLEAGSIYSRSISTAKSQEPCATIPVLDGNVFKITYTAGGNLLRFRFIYAEGDQ